MRFALLLLALNLALVLHELGHLVAALLMRVPVREVQLGLGPPLLSFKARGVRYGLGSLLVGARVELAGENPFRKGARPPGDAAGDGMLSPRRRLALALAGPLGSALAGVALLTILHWVGTHVPVTLTVGKVLPGSPAAIAGVQPGDRVERLDGQEPESWGRVLEGIQQFEGAAVPLLVRRGDQVQELSLALPSNGRRSEIDLGISQQYSFRSLPLPGAVGAATVHASLQVATVLETARGLLSSPADAGLTPVVGVRQSAERSAPGADTFLRGAAMWCLLLALLHLLPIPPLDGGVALLAAIGLWRKRPLSPAVELALAALGLLLVLGVGALWVRQRVPARGTPTSPPGPVVPAPAAIGDGSSPDTPAPPRAPASPPPLEPLIAPPAPAAGAAVP